CLYLYCSGYNIKNIAEELGTNRKTVCLVKILPYSITCRNEFTENYVMVYPKQILKWTKHILFLGEMAGVGIFRGKKIWVIDALCRVTKMTRLKIIKRRNKHICENFAVYNISFDLKVIIEYWRGYRDLN
ncbi:hypothetical protein COBT_003762, partial [Conglomerata obtusa]